jgi:peptide/nickel transport system substrate-binding protein
MEKMALRTLSGLAIRLLPPALPGILLLLVLAGLASPAPAADLDKDTLRLLLWQAPTTLNPHFAQGAKDQIASRIVYEPLASFNARGELVPFLATEIPSLENGEVAADGKSVVWKLKHDIKWSDGVPFTATDVLFTYSYVTNPDVGSGNASIYKTVEKVEALDDFTVKIDFKKVNPAWALPFVGVKGMIIPEHVFRSYNNATATAAPPNLAPIGTGPYRLKEFRKEDVLLIGDDVVNTVKLIYEPNPYYRDIGKLRFKQITLQGGGDATVAANAVLRDGIVDFAWNLQLDDKTLSDLEAKGVGKLGVIAGAYVERIVINFTDPNRETTEGERSSLQFPHPFLVDPQVRTALALAVDREKIAQLYGREGRVTANLLVAPSIYDSPNTSFAFDLKKAAAMLDQDGWIDSNGDGIRDKNGVSLSMVFQTNINPVRQKIQDIIKEDFESIGVHVENKLIDSSVYFGTDVNNPNTSDHFYADLEAFAWGNKSPDPGAYMSALTCGEAAQKKNDWGGTNSGRYCNPAYDALYDKSTTELDPQKRRQLFIQMNDLAMNDVSLIPLVASANVSGIGKDIVGFDGTPWDAEDWNIADWHRAP